jgi:hypothetical protein
MDTENKGLPGKKAVIFEEEKIASEEEEMKKKTKLSFEWAIWESLDSMGGMSAKMQSQKDYLANIHTIGEFNNLISFWQLWNSIPHADPCNFFTIPDEKKGTLCNKFYEFALY